MTMDGATATMRKHSCSAILFAGLLAMVFFFKQKTAYEIGSLASQFLQSKTQITVLEHDDEASPGCQDRHFIKAAPLATPVSRAIGKFTERKWREIWTLARCGTNVYYLIFFTEEGSGGAYYATV